MTESPLAISFGARIEDEDLISALVLVCEARRRPTRPAAMRWRSVTGSLKTTLTDQRKTLAQNLLALPMTTATADQVHLLIDHGMRALASRTITVDENLVRLTVKTKGELSDLGVAALTSIPALEMTRLASARPLDEQRQQRVLTGLLGYVNKESNWPAGATGAKLFAPESRLSWIAELLPYYDEFEWHRKLNFAQDWNTPENRPVTRRPLDPFINPALGLSLTEAGFPVTHYVGLAGVGSDAADLGPAGRSAGVFSYRNLVAPAQITDGAAQTIALMGVSSNLGPWAAGGQATVRALTAQPYVNGPDGFGSGQADGMFVGMADGSVRFISKDIDPNVLERLATIHGGEPVELAARRRPCTRPLPATASRPACAASGPAPAIVRCARERWPAIAKLRSPASQVRRQRPVLAKEKLPAVDVAARLQDKLSAIDQPPIPWDQFLRLFTQLTNVPTTIDPGSLMVEAGIHLDDRVEVHARRDDAPATCCGRVLDRTWARVCHLPRSIAAHHA